jgi:hypothetical protein
MISAFIDWAERAGLPVAMLKYVQQHYKIELFDRALSGTDPKGNVLYLNRGVWKLTARAILGGTVDDEGLRMVSRVARQSACGNHRTT